MNFALSDQQKELQESLHRVIGGTSPIRRVHEIFDQDSGFDNGLWHALKEFGVGGLCVPAEYDGLGLELIDVALAAEMLGYHGAPVPFFGHALATVACALSDDETIKRRWLPELASGRVLGTVAIAEDDERWQADQWTLAIKAGALHGEKYYVPAGDEAELIVVGLSNGELGLVEPDASGVSRMPQKGVDRTRRFSRLRFDHTPIVKLTTGRNAGQRLVDAALVLLAADAFGGARRVLDMTVGYVGEREQFGVKIGQFQAIKHQLANMALEIEPCRGLYWYAAHAFDHRPAECAAAAALAKSHLAERFLQAGRDAVEAHGGIGFTWEYDLHIWLKRAMFDWAWAGSPSVHRERYATLVDW